ncbi:MAG: hypothetical protein H8E17_18400 [Deltaproteobacteria bacterium]|nr:hypothetical protein [Deltaproteobacteria bacterium]
MVVKYNGTDAVNTVHSYGYTPFGDFYAADTYETAAEADNPFKFTGQSVGWAMPTLIKTENSLSLIFAV